MSTSLQVVARAAGQTFTDNTTRFIPIWSSIGATTATELQVQGPIRDAGSVNQLGVRVSANTASVTSTVTLRKNLADTALTLSISADATGEFEDTANAVAVVATDEADIEVTVPAEAGTNQLTLSVVRTQFTPTDGGTTLSLWVSTSTTWTQTDQTRFFQMGDGGDAALIENNANIRIGGPFTARNLYTYVSANTRTDTCSITTRRNDAAGGQSVSYATTETGVKEDTSGTDSLPGGAGWDEFNGAVVLGGGSGTLTLRVVSVVLASTSGQFQFVTSGATQALAQAFNVTNYLALGGILGAPTTTESATQLLSRLTFTARQLTANVTANSIATSATVVRTRLDTANGNQSLSYAAAETGWKSDTTNTDAIVTGSSRLNYQIVTPNTSGTFTVRCLTMLGEIPQIGWPLVTEAPIIVERGVVAY